MLQFFGVVTWLQPEQMCKKLVSMAKTVTVLKTAQCLVDVNECSSNPCQNSGTCNDGVNGYTCDCVPGYVGNECGTGMSTH